MNTFGIYPNSTKLLLALGIIWILESGATRLFATVVAWGDNTYGQSSSSPPAETVGAKAIAAGYWHNLVVTATDKVVAWGLNDYGQINVPSTLADVVFVAAGRNHSVALKQDGSVVAWGDNTYGQTNVPPDLTNAVAIAAGGFHNAALRGDGMVTCWGYNFYQQTNVPPSVTNAVAVACGNAFTLALLDSGRVVGWGDDYYGQIDIPSDITNAVAIAAGGFHGIAIMGDGTLRCWGYNAYGQTNIPSDATNIVAVAGGYFHSLALRGDGVIKQWGDTSLGQTNPPVGLARLTRLAAGYAHSLVLKDDKPFILVQPQDVVTNEGRSVRFTARATGTLPLSGRWWWVSGTNIVDKGAGSKSTSNDVVTFSLMVSNASISNAGGYYVVVTNTWGAATSRVATLSFPVAPTITNQPQSVMTNVGATVAFSVGATGTMPLSYQWWFNGTELGWVGSTNRLVLSGVTTNEGGNYWVVVSNGVGAVTSQVATLTFSGGTEIITQPQDQAVRQGDSATFWVVATGDEPLSYQWWFNLTNLLVDATNSVYTIGEVAATNAGGYHVVVGNVLGWVTSRVATLTVLCPPRIVVQPQDVVTNEGWPVRFTARATGTLPLSGRWWWVSGTNIVDKGAGSKSTSNDVVTFSLMVSNASISNAGGYYVVVTNTWGAATSRVATLSFVPTITNQPQSVMTNVGATVAFSVGATGTMPLSYQWWFNGTELGWVGSTNRLVLSGVTTNEGGNYWVVVSNGVGAVTSQVATLSIVYPALTPAYIMLLTHSCTGDDFLLISLEPGKNYRIQSSTNLHTWMDITHFLSSSVLFGVTNSVDVKQKLLFYRVVSP